MPTDPERRTHGIPEGVPILVITEPGEEPRLLPADRTILQFDAEK
jgi:hypothetical protein